MQDEILADNDSEAITDNSAVESDEEDSQGTKPGNPPKRQTSTRKRALESTYMAASRIANFYNKRKRVRINDFDKGDCVSVCVPKGDRTGKDLARITCVIKEVFGHEVKSFVLGTEYVGSDFALVIRRLTTDQSVSKTATWSYQ